MRRWLTAFLACCLAMSLLTTQAFAALSAAEIYEHNAKITDTWLNPGDYVRVPEIGDDLYARRNYRYLIGLSNEIVEGKTTDFEKLEAVNQWMVRNMHYDYDSYNDPSYFFRATPKDEKELAKEGFILDDPNYGPAESTMTAILRRGICSRYADLMKALLNVQGIPCIKVRGHAGKSIPNEVEEIKNFEEIAYSDLVNHAWNAVYIDGEWILADATWDCGNTYRNGVYEKDTWEPRFFNASLERFSKDHYFSEFGKTEEENIPDEWAKAEVKAAIDKGLVPFALQGSYREAISRQEFCQLIQRFLQKHCGDLTKTVFTNQSPFTDVNDSAVTLVSYFGITLGVRENEFAPEKSISRQEAAVMLSRLAQMFIADVDVASASYYDEADIAPWVLNAVSEVTAWGMMSGSQGNFNPKGTFTIQEAIVALERLDEILAKK